MKGFLGHTGRSVGIWHKILPYEYLSRRALYAKPNIEGSLCQAEYWGGAIFCMHHQLTGGAGLRMRTWIIAQFSLIIVLFWRHEEAIFLLLLLALPGKVLLSEQTTGTHPLWIPPTSSDQCGIVDTSTSQKKLNPVCLANLFLWSLLFCLFPFCLIEFIMKMVCYGCSLNVRWLTSSH